MIRIEGEARLFGFVGLVWSLVNSSYIHFNEFGIRKSECGLRPIGAHAYAPVGMRKCPQGQHPIVYNHFVF
jgi:hypothetical protein